MSRRQAVLELFVAGALWGFGFVATVWVLRSQSPSELLTWRFLIASAAGLLLWRLLPALRAETTRKGLLDFWLSIPAGLLLAGMLLPQTVGLLQTTASKSGFLTTLYIIIVPLLSHLFLGVKTKWQVWCFAGLALAGAFLLMGADLRDLNPGDLWTLLCAVIAALHILYIGRISHRIRDSFLFNSFQSLWCLLATLPFLFSQDNIKWWPTESLAWAGLIMLGLGSSVVAFTIQIRAQKVLSPTLSSMLFLIESPFALIFGILLLNESFGPLQAAGAVLILFASAMTIRYE